MTLLKESPGNVLDPRGDRGGEHEALELRQASAFDRVHNLFDVLLEAKVEHLISFVENSKLKARKVKVSAFHVIHDSATGSDEDVDTTSELVGLLIEASATIDSQNVVFTLVVPEGAEFFGNLESELSSRGQYHSLGFSLAKGTLLSETRDHG